MKKSFFLAALVLISAGCFAQKNKVNEARNLADAETPDFPAARAAIAEALQNDETKDLANTWYIAGLIGYKEFDAEKYKMYMGQKYNSAKAAEAIVESINYWTKAYEISQVPTYDKKGRAKYDTKTPKNILPKVKEYFDNQVLLVAGNDAANENNPSKAYDLYIEHLNMPELPMMQTLDEPLLRDTSYYMFLCQAGIYAYEAKRMDEAIATLQRMNTEEAKKVADRKILIYANQYLYQIQIELKDTTAAIATLERCITEYPEDSWFMQNMINLYINSGQEEKAVEYLDLAIQREPNVGQYYNSKGSILALIGHYEEAFVAFEKALQLEPNNANFYTTYGGAYINKGNKLNDDATYLDNEAYQAAKVNIDAAYTEALKYYEKAYELAPENYDTKRDLRSLYYRLGMNDKYEALAD